MDLEEQAPYLFAIGAVARASGRKLTTNEGVPEPALNLPKGLAFGTWESETPQVAMRPSAPVGFTPTLFP